MNSSDKLPKKEIPIIGVEDWERIVAESEGASELLNSPKFAFFREYLDNIKNSILRLIATNSVKEVVEYVHAPGGGVGQPSQIASTIKTTKEEQLNELAGQFKMVEKIIKDLTAFSIQKEEYEKKAEEKAVIIAVSKEDETSRTV